MKNRLYNIIRLCVTVLLMGVTGQVYAQSTPRLIVNDLTNGFATWYSDAGKTTAIAAVPYSAAEQTLYIDIQPAEGYWTSAEVLNGKVEKYVLPSAADARTRGSLNLATYDVKPVDGQTYAANGAGVYQVTISGMGTEKEADMITKFVLTADFKACVSVSINVVDIANGEELEGATVQMKDGVGNLVKEWVSTVTAYMVDGLMPGVEYTLEETVAPDGYLLATGCSFSIDESGKVSTTGTITEEGVLLVENSKSKVEVIVVDIATREQIEGATVQVIDKNGNIVEEWVSTTKSHVIESLLTGVEYTLKETVPPDDYLLSTDCSFTIDKNGKVTSTGSLTEEGVLLVENTKIKKLGSIELNPTEFTYDRQAHKPTVTAKDQDNNVIPEDQYTVSYQDSEGNAVTDPTAAGTYTVVITDNTGTGYDNYVVSGTATFDIKKATLTITAHAQTKVFGTTDPELTYTSEGLVSGDVITGTLRRAEGEDVGTYAITQGTLSAGDNYTIAFTGANLTITEASFVDGDVKADGYEGDYDAQAHTINVTAPEGTTIKYGTEEGSYSLTEAPAYTNVGSYTVYFQVTMANMNPVAGSQTVVIKPVAATVTITGHNNSTTYDGEEHSVSGYDVSISNPLYKESDFTFSGTAKAARTELGMTNMGLTAEQFTNTNANFSATFNVTDGYQTITSPADVVVMITGHSSTVDFDGKEHSVSGYDVSISNPLYKESDFTFSGTAEATGTNAGKTMMGLDEAQFMNKNTNFLSVTFSVTDGYQAISPIATTVTITGHNNTTTYDGEEHSVSGYDVSFSNALYKESDFTFSGTATAARTNEGTTYMGLAENHFTNNSANFSPVTFNVTDGYQTITSVTDVVVTITGHSSTVDYDGKEHSVNGYDVEISNPLYKESDFTFSGTSAAVRKDAGTTSMGLNASQFKNNNPDFTNVMFKVTDGYQTISPITATVTIKGHSNVAVYDGTEHSVSGYDVSFSNDLYNESYLTFSGTASAAQTDQGTTYMGLTEDQFTNTHANFSTVTFSVIDGYQTINKKAVKPTVTVMPKIYDGNTEAQVSVTADTGVKGESLTITGVTGTFEDANVGTDKTVTINSDNAVVTPGNENTKVDNYIVTYPATTTASIAKAKLTVKANDMTIKYGDTAANDGVTYDGFVNSETADVLSGTLSYSYKTKADGSGDDYTTTSPVGTYYIIPSGLTSDNYDITFEAGKLTVTESLNTGSGIEVRRNDTKALVDNVATLTEMADGKLRIDQVKIAKLDDATAENPVSVSIYIPASLKTFDQKTGDTYGMGSDIIVTDASVPVTDVYMPETEEILHVATQAFRLVADESRTAFIHVPLFLLDDYALTPGLKAEYEVGKVMTTVKPTTQYWTFSSAVDVVVPEDLTANICAANGLNAVAITAIQETTATVDGASRILVKANNGVLMKGTAGKSYDLRAWPSSERPSGLTPIPTDDAKTYAGNELVPAIVATHFTPTAYYILYEDTFYELKPDDNTSVSPCKAVLRRTSAAQSRSLSIAGEGTTGMERLTPDLSEGEGEWYSLDGRKLDGKPSRKGLYIKDGKKTVIR